jgi:hypothetical protein
MITVLDPIGDIKAYAAIGLNLVIFEVLYFLALSRTEIMSASDVVKDEILQR